MWYSSARLEDLFKCDGYCLEKCLELSWRYLVNNEVGLDVTNNFVGVKCWR